MTFAHSLQNADVMTAAQNSAPPRSLADSAPPHQLHPKSANDPLPSSMRERVSIVFAAGRYEDASTACAKLLQHYAASAFLWTIQGLCHLKRRALNDALTCLNRARELAPSTPEAYVGMADVYAVQGDIKAAETHYQMALTLDAHHLLALNNFANFLSEIGRPEDAAPLLDAARELAPDNAVILYNLANAKRQIGDAACAKELYRQALDHAPDLYEARSNYGQMLCLDREFEAANAQFAKLLAINPDDDRIRANKLHAMAMLNDFNWIADYQTHRRHLGLRGTPVAPFMTIGLEDNPDLLRLRTQAYAESHMPTTQAATPCAARPASRPDRLRIGYFSADFHNHATMHLMSGLLRSHDKSRFEIQLFSYGPDRSDTQQDFAREAADKFHAVGQLSDHGLIALAQAEDLDIAVDLKGFTGRSRSGIFASRLAPVHMSFLGYPGTMGTPAMDYLITDSVVSPVGSERHFEEHLIRLPHSYQPNDDQRHIAPRQFTRADCGLPEEGFIFCCFNNSYKITPREFDIWMRLMTKVDGSVLWLLSGGPTSEANLRREAELRGVCGDRLIFAGRMQQDEHLARQKVADLFLDTFAVNAHTTCSDALWAGLPVLTRPGQQFAARVGASLLSAMNLPTLIAKDDADYEARALQYAQDPDALLALRSKLMVNRRRTPLFDTSGYTCNLESAFDAAFERWRLEQPPAHLTVNSPDTRPSSKPSASVAAA